MTHLCRSSFMQRYQSTHRQSL